MRLVTLTLLITSAILLASACTTADPGPTNQTQPTLAASPAARANVTPDEFAAARANFQKNCSACHGPDAKGGPVTVQGKKLKVPSMTEGHALKHSDEDFVKQITNGDDEMPAFKDKLSAAEITDLVRFIRKEFQGR